LVKPAAGSGMIATPVTDTTASAGSYEPTWAVAATGTALPR
jgi:hypothetical protein